MNESESAGGCIQPDEKLTRATAVDDTSVATGERG
jgi:hypothetical protein